MKPARLLILALALGFTPACVFTHVTQPLDTDLNPTVFGDKIGEATAKSVLWMVAWGDRGAHAAALDAGITTAHHMDIRTLSVLFGLYSQQTTIVYGE